MKTRIAPRDTRSYSEFLCELSGIKEQPLDVQLLFLRNRQNRDRAMSIPAHKLNKMLLKSGG